MIVYRLICVVQTALPASKEIQAAEPPPHLGTVSFHHEEPACAGTVHEVLYMNHHLTWEQFFFIMSKLPVQVLYMNHHHLTWEQFLFIMRNLRVQVWNIIHNLTWEQTNGQTDKPGHRKATI